MLNYNFNLQMLDLGLMTTGQFMRKKSIQKYSFLTYSIAIIFKISLVFDDTLRD